MWVEIARAALLTVLLLVAIGGVYALFTTLRQLDFTLSERLSALADKIEAGDVSPDLLARLEAAERRITDAVDTMERRYRSMIQRDRRAGIAEAAEGDDEPAPSAQEPIPIGRQRLQRKHAGR